jgi:hypothetical protein
MFQSFYESFWQHPLLLWMPSVLFLVFVRPRATDVARASQLFALLSIIDALFTGPMIQLFGPLTASAVMILFVIVGDFRLFFFIERFSGREENFTRKLGETIIRAAGWALVVPVLQGVLTRLLPHAFENVRYTFLCYELLFFGLAAFLRSRIIPRRALPEDVRRWHRELCAFAMTYYALWSLADVVILLGFDGGYLLRVVPNVLYYGLFIPFVFWRAPPRLRTTGAT